MLLMLMMMKLEQVPTFCYSFSLVPIQVCTEPYNRAKSPWIVQAGACGMAISAAVPHRAVCCFTGLFEFWIVKMEPRP